MIHDPYSTVTTCFLDGHVSQEPFENYYELMDLRIEFHYEKYDDQMIDEKIAFGALSE